MKRHSWRTFFLLCTSSVNIFYVNTLFTPFRSSPHRNFNFSWFLFICNNHLIMLRLDKSFIANLTISFSNTCTSELRFRFQPFQKLKSMGVAQRLLTLAVPDSGVAGLDHHFILLSAPWQNLVLWPRPGRLCPRRLIWQWLEPGVCEVSLVGDHALCLHLSGCLPFVTCPGQPVSDWTIVHTPQIKHRNAKIAFQLTKIPAAVTSIICSGQNGVTTAVISKALATWGSSSGQNFFQCPVLLQ